jgi:uncharacterized protein involved in outer membrane biogenesis
MRVPRPVLAVTVLAAGALAAAVLLLQFESPVLGRAALARIGSLLGGRVDARAFRFRLVRGLELEGITASSPIAGGRFGLEADALVLDHRLWPLLGGRVEIERVVLRRPRLRLEQGAPGPAPSPRSPALPGVAALSLRVVEARMEDGTVEVVGPGQPPMTVSKLDFTMRELALAGPTLAALSAGGRAQADSIRFARTEATEVEGEFTLRGGALAARPLRFRTKEGRFEATVEARLDRLPLTYSLDLRGDPLDLNAVAGAAGGGSLGPGRLRLTGEGTGSAAAAFRGQGMLHLDAGRVPASPMLQRVQAFLTEELVGARYEALDAPFRVRNGRVELDSFRLRAGRYALDMRGWVALEGPLALTVDARAPRETVRLPGVPPGALDALTDAEGYVTVPLTVTGTQREPVVRPDTGALTAAAGRGVGAAAARKAGEGILDWLRRRSEPRQ